MKNQRLLGFSLGRVLSARAATLTMSIAVLYACVGCGSSAADGPIKTELAPGAPPVNAATTTQPGTTAAPAAGSMPDRVPEGYGGK
jgi:hypothetical protein